MCSRCLVADVQLKHCLSGYRQSNKNPFNLAIIKTVEFKKNVVKLNQQNFFQLKEVMMS
jgi:hypothetical protein